MRPINRSVVFISILLVALILSACVVVPATPAPTSQEEANKALVSHFADLFNEHDLEAIFEFYSIDHIRTTSMTSEA